MTPEVSIAQNKPLPQPNEHADPDTELILTSVNPHFGTLGYLGVYDLQRKKKKIVGWGGNVFTKLLLRIRVPSLKGMGWVGGAKAQA